MNMVQEHNEKSISMQELFLLLKKNILGHSRRFSSLK